jgi:hypothetical protein
MNDWGGMQKYGLFFGVLFSHVLHNFLLDLLGNCGAILRLFDDVSRKKKTKFSCI